MKRSSVGQGSQKPKIRPYGKKKYLQSSAEISFDNSIAKSNSPRHNRDHHQQHQEENL